MALTAPVAAEVGHPLVVRGAAICRLWVTGSRGNLGRNQSQVEKRWGIFEHNAEVANRL